jgi:hypothetical protein
MAKYLCVCYGMHECNMYWTNKMESLSIGLPEIGEPFGLMVFIFEILGEPSI